MIELVSHKSMWGKFGGAGRFDGLKGRCSAGRGVAVLLLGSEVRLAQPVVVLRLYLQAPGHVLLRQERHGAWPPVLPDPLPTRNAIAEAEGGEEHGACAGTAEGDLAARPRGPSRARHPPDHAPPEKATAALTEVGAQAEQIP